MKCKLVIKDGLNVLEIHADNDIEAIALQAWHDDYFKDLPTTKAEKSMMLFVYTTEKKNDKPFQE